jgi:hypothetical protein
MCYTQTVDYWVLKRNKILVHASTWVNPEDIMLSEISQIRRANLLWFIYIRHLEWINSETQSIMQVTMAAGGELCGGTINGYQVSV